MSLRLLFMALTIVIFAVATYIADRSSKRMVQRQRVRLLEWDGQSVEERLNVLRDVKFETLEWQRRWSRNVSVPIVMLVWFIPISLFWTGIVADDANKLAEAAVQADREQEYDQCIDENVRTTAGRDNRLGDIEAVQRELDLKLGIPDLVAEEIPGYLDAQDPAVRRIVDSFLQMDTAGRRAAIASLEADVERLQAEYDTYVAEQSPTDCGEDPSATDG